MLLLNYRPLKPPTLLLGYSGAVPSLVTSGGGAGDRTRAAGAETAELEVVSERLIRSPAPSSSPPRPFAAAMPAITDEPDEAHEPPEPKPASTMPPLPEITPVLVRSSNDAFSEGPPPAARPRLRPEIHADPRTVFKQRGREPTRLEPKAVTPSVRIADGPVMDLLIVPQLPSFRASEQGVKAVVGYLRSTQILTAKGQKAGPDGSMTIELLPDVFVHLAFYDEGGAPPGPPCIAESRLWFGPKPVALPFGADRASCFRLELVGVRSSMVSPGFIARLNSILYLKAEVLAVPHDPTRLLRPTTVMAAEPIPLFDVQER